MEVLWQTRYPQQNQDSTRLLFGPASFLSSSEAHTSSDHRYPIPLYTAFFLSLYKNLCLASIHKFYIIRKNGYSIVFFVYSARNRHNLIYLAIACRPCINFGEYDYLYRPCHIFKLYKCHFVVCCFRRYLLHSRDDTPNGDAVSRALPCCFRNPSE